MKLPLIALGSAFLVGASFVHADPGPMELFYTSPAPFNEGVTSHEALPIGNGHMAAMVYGGVASEVIQFNEDTVWFGGPHDYSNPGAVEVLDEIQALVWQGEGQAAYEQYAEGNFMSEPIRQSPYVGAGELHFDIPHSGATNYRRTLDLETATAIIEYDVDGVTYRRETFASYPDDVIVMRFTASEPGNISFSYYYGTLHDNYTVTVDGADLVLDAEVNDDTHDRRQSVSEVEFQARVRIAAEGGTVTPGSDSITVADADSVTLILHVASNVVSYDDLSADPDALATAAIEAASAKTFEQLRSTHLADYQELFNRVEIDLGTTAAAELPTDERLDRIEAAMEPMEDAQEAGRIADFTENYDFDDPQLIALNFQMARYLMIAASRPGSQPMNLQGKWSNELEPSWESKMTLNINQEMNYWAAEITNLAETHLPMVDLVRDLSETGATVAEVHYGADGWMVHHNTDLWRGAAPINSPGGLWPTGGAWLSMHVWWHYQYSGDKEYLAEVYPLLKGAAQFFEDFLVMDPRDPSDEYAAWGGVGHPQWGKYLLTNPSHSPEQPNKALGDNGELVAGPMIDNQLIRGLFTYVIEASEILDVDAEFRQKLTEMRALLPPNMIGQHGQLQEWLEDVDTKEDGHRHLSHMIDVFPGEGIHPIYEPELAAAATVTLDAKGDLSNNTSWSRAWKMNLRAALLQGDHAFMILNDIIGTSHTDNMTFSDKGNGEDQIDGNLGALMGTAQFFMQTRRGEIHLLPALPTLLPTGSVTGLRAKGGFEVDIAWENGELVSGAIRSDLGRTARVRVDVDSFKVYHGDEEVDVTEISENLYEFETEAGGEYRLLEAGGTDTGSWAGYPVDDAGRIETGEYFGSLYVLDAPWVWSYALDSWIYLPEEIFSAIGSWAYFVDWDGPEEDGSNETSDHWSGYVIAPGGWVDTGNFLRSLYVSIAPWIWSDAFYTWIYIPEGFVSPDGSWGYVSKRAA